MLNLVMFAVVMVISRSPLSYNLMEEEYGDSERWWKDRVSGRDIYTREKVREGMRTCYDVPRWCTSLWSRHSESITMTLLLAVREDSESICRDY
jgi:hypothetical protein